MSSLKESVATTRSNWASPSFSISTADRWPASQWIEPGQDVLKLGCGPEHEVV